MPKFRSRPVVVEAVRFTAERAKSESTFPAGVDKQTRGCGSWLYFVTTTHGQRAYLDIGDWVVTEPDGSGHYPCKDSIFRARWAEIDPTERCPEIIKGEQCELTSGHDGSHRWAGGD